MDVFTEAEQQEMATLYDALCLTMARHTPLDTRIAAQALGLVLVRVLATTDPAGRMQAAEWFFGHLMFDLKKTLQ